MKWLIILIVLLCVLLALWYWRDDITGTRLRFAERELGGARFKAPDWRESVFHDDADSGRLILKHKRNDKRIVYIAWQPLPSSMQGAPGDIASAMRSKLEPALAELTASAFAEMTGTTAKVEQASSGKKVAGQDAALHTLTFADERVGPGLLWIWPSPSTRQLWTLAVVDDNSEQAERIASTFFDSFAAAAAPVEPTTTTQRKLTFDQPPGWRVHDENRTSIAYVSPNEDALLELHHGTRTSRSRMTKEYAQSLAKSMVEATGATWHSQSAALRRDTRLGAPVAVVRGTARIAGDQRAYEIRLWIAPSTTILYTAALSTFDAAALDTFSTTFDRIRIAE